MKLFNRLAGVFAITTSFSCFNISGYPNWPSSSAPLATPTGEAEAPSTEDDEIVRSLPVCVAAKSWSAGDLGTSVLYRYHREGRRLSVGYFVYWSTERPWGPNVLSYAVLPALFVDAFYSHFLFMFPGAQRFLHGPGDIEGARIVYEQNDDGKWVPVSGAVDDAFHHEVTLAPSDFVDATGRVRLTTDVWSHQLGASSQSHPLADPERGQVCFGGATLAPLTAQLADQFRLGSPGDPRRAPPAWKLVAPPSMPAVRVTAAPRQSPRVVHEVAAVEP